MPPVNGIPGFQDFTVTPNPQGTGQIWSFNVPNGYYVDKIDFGNGQRPNNPVAKVYDDVQIALQAQANQFQEIIGGENYCGLTPTEMLQQTFNECNQLIYSQMYGCQPQSPPKQPQIIQYGQPAPGMAPQIIIIYPNAAAQQTNPAQTHDDPLGSLRGLEKLTQDAIKDAMGGKTNPDGTIGTNGTAIPDGPDEKTAMKVKNAAVNIYKELDNFSPDSKRVIQVIESLSETERGYLEIAYGNFYGHGDPDTLRDALVSELSDNDETRAIQLMNNGAFKDAASGAIALHQAMNGFGTDSRTVHYIINNSSKEQLQAISQAFDKLYSEDKSPGTLREWIEDDFSGSEEKELLEKLI